MANELHKLVSELEEYKRMLEQQLPTEERAIVEAKVEGLKKRLESAADDHEPRVKTHK